QQPCTHASAGSPRRCTTVAASGPGIVRDGPGIALLHVVGLELDGDADVRSWRRRRGRRPRIRTTALVRSATAKQALWPCRPFTTPRPASYSSAPHLWATASLRPDELPEDRGSGLVARPGPSSRLARAMNRIRHP